MFYIIYFKWNGKCQESTVAMVTVQLYWIEHNLNCPMDYLLTWASIQSVFVITHFKFGFKAKMITNNSCKKCGTLYSVASKTQSEEHKVARFQVWGKSNEK